MIAGKPEAITLYSSATSGMTARTKQNQKMPVATLSLAFRLPEIGRKVSAGLAGFVRSGVEVDISR